MTDKDDDLLQKADALMRRRRVFVAGASEAGEADKASADPAADDDVPLLTEIVGPDALIEVSSPSTVDIAALRRALAAELESWLDNDLPSHVQRVLDGITDQLIIQLSEKAHAELLVRLQDVLAEAQQGAKPDAADD